MINENGMKDINDRGQQYISTPILMALEYTALDNVYPECHLNSDTMYEAQLAND